jgi:hypothetical protein
MYNTPESFAVVLRTTVASKSGDCPVGWYQQREDIEPIQAIVTD